MYPWALEGISHEITILNKHKISNTYNNLLYFVDNGYPNKNKEQW
jgi:hypothetical protein